jgi:hypothetical protein
MSSCCSYEPSCTFMHPPCRHFVTRCHHCHGSCVCMWSSHCFYLVKAKKKSNKKNSLPGAQDHVDTSSVVITEEFWKKLEKKNYQGPEMCLGPHSSLVGWQDSDVVNEYIISIQYMNKNKKTRGSRCGAWNLAIHHGSGSGVLTLNINLAGKVKKEKTYHTSSKRRAPAFVVHD